MLLLRIILIKTILSQPLEGCLNDGDPALFEVAQLVAEHLAEVIAEYEVDAER